jgi:hypothetical protein
MTPSSGKVLTSVDAIQQQNASLLFELLYRLADG